MANIKLLYEKRGKGKFGPHFRLTKAGWGPADFFEPYGWNESRNQVYGKWSKDGNIIQMAYETDNTFEILRPFTMMASAIGKKDNLVFITSELFVNEDEARVFCLKSNIAYVRMDDNKVKVEDEIA